MIQLQALLSQLGIKLLTNSQRFLNLNIAILTNIKGIIMKKLIFWIALCAGFMLSGWSAMGQCNSELYVNKSMKSLESGFQYSKSYRIDGRGGNWRKVEYTCVISKDTNYQIRITGKDGAAQGLIGTLYDSKRNELVSSFYNNKFLDTWIINEK